MEAGSINTITANGHSSLSMSAYSSPKYQQHFAGLGT